MKSHIVVRGARQHNLKGFDLEIPRRSFTVITGPSGSGKSSLAFDTIYAEGQRRYVESLSAYARQFLERMEKPDVDSIDGLSPAVAIEQKNPTKTSRSTVGTATEIYDYLRLLWARVGRTFCPVCGREMKPRHRAVGHRRRAGAARRARASPSPFRSRLEQSSRTRSSSRTCARRDFVRVVIDGALMHLDELPPRHRRHERGASCWSSSTGSRSRRERAQRLADAVGTAFREGDGDAVVLLRPDPATLAGSGTQSDDARRCRDSVHRALRVPERRHPRADADAAALLVQQSARRVRDVQRLRRDARVRRSARSSPIPTARCATARSIRGRSRATRASGARWPSSRRRTSISMDVPWRELPLARSRPAAVREDEGLQGHLALSRASSRRSATSSTSASFCGSIKPRRNVPTCHGTKLQPEALQVRIAGRTIAEVSDLPVERLVPLARDARALAITSSRSPRTSSSEAREPRRAFSATWGSTISR